MWDLPKVHSQLEAAAGLQALFRGSKRTMGTRNPSVHHSPCHHLSSARSISFYLFFDAINTPFILQRYEECHGIVHDPWGPYLVLYYPQWSLL